jgi:hypothetical protein
MIPKRTCTKRRPVEFESGRLPRTEVEGDYCHITSVVPNGQPRYVLG